jgi:hypothetical protein
MKRYNMKNISILSLIVMLFTLPVNGQSRAASSSSREGFWVRPSIFIGSGTLSGVNARFTGLSLSSRPKITLGGGADIGYMLGDKIGVFAGLWIGRYSYDLWGEYKFAKLDIIGRNVYIEMPMYFRFISSHYGKTGFFLDAGAKHQFLIACKTNIQGRDQAARPILRREVGNKNNIYNKYALSPLLYLGVNIHCGSVVELNIGPEISFQATSLFDPSQKDEYDDRMNGHYFIIAIKGAIGFQCSK